MGSRAGTSLAEDTVKCVNAYFLSNSAVTCRPSLDPPPFPQHHLSLLGPRRLSKTLNADSPPPKPGSSFAVNVALYFLFSSGLPSSSGSVKSLPSSEVSPSLFPNLFLPVLYRLRWPPTRILLRPI